MSGSRQVIIDEQEDEVSETVSSALGKRCGYANIMKMNWFDEKKVQFTRRGERGEGKGWTKLRWEKGEGKRN